MAQHRMLIGQQGDLSIWHDMLNGRHIDQSTWNATLTCREVGMPIHAKECRIIIILGEIDSSRMAIKWADQVN